MTKNPNNDNGLQGQWTGTPAPNKRFLWIIETMCNAFSFEVVEKIDLRNPLIRKRQTVCVLIQ